MFKYEFYINDNPDFKGPTFKILTKKYCMLGLLSFCKPEYMHEVVGQAGEVYSGKLVSFEFGFESVVIIFKRSKSIIYYNDFENQATINTDELYSFLKAWKQYLDQWQAEKELNPGK
jgi:hypothetical protein